MPNRKKDAPTPPPPPTFLRCVVCGDAIPTSRAMRKAVTCCDTHGKIFKSVKRQMRHSTRCRLCNRPSTPAERQEFLAWRRSKKLKPGRKQKPMPEASPSPLESHLGTIAVP